MPTLTDDNEVVASYIFNLIKTNASALGLKTVLYGDHDLIPHTPAVCVVPGPESTIYNGVGGRPVMITFETYALVIYNKLQDIQANLHSCGTLATQVKRLVHTDPMLGIPPNQLVIDCMCTDNEPGIVIKGGQLSPANRLTFSSRSKVRIS